MPRRDLPPFKLRAVGEEAFTFYTPTSQDLAKTTTINIAPRHTAIMLHIERSHNTLHSPSSPSPTSTRTTRFDSIASVFTFHFLSFFVQVALQPFGTGMRRQRATTTAAQIDPTIKGYASALAPPTLRPCPGVSSAFRLPIKGGQTRRTT
ncbi:hypothetical protein MSAN_00575200 [Mycena sanguinolenta]|uniref:Uncharacterized protein n=1 Tax=Mycena sanguinolenta TaxID=230812 RepID=A0A8H7DGM8_9AGAR|nr:hypothetical protein MSAN_00575200 [Mycena sanguinolenta]